MKTCSVCALLLIGLMSFPSVADTIHVPADQPTIQAGIDAAVDGDTVLVTAGTWAENIDFLGKQITVISEAGPDLTIIHGSPSNRVVTFSAGETTETVLHGFTITHGFETALTRGGGRVWRRDHLP